MSHFRKYLARYSTAIAFLVLAFFGGVAINGSAKNTARSTTREATTNLYTAQIRSCDRTNRLIAEVNQRIAADQTLRTAVIGFLTTARDARRSTYKTTRNAADKRAAERYAVLIGDVRHGVHYNRVPPVNCKKEIPKS